MRRSVFVIAVAVAIGIAVARAGGAAKTGPGISVGSGSVFVPNPVQSLGIDTLTDQKDADSAVPGGREGLRRPRDPLAAPASRS